MTNISRIWCPQMKNEIITTPVVVKEKALPIPSLGKDALPLKIVLKSLKSCRWWWGGELWKGGLITFDNRRPTLGDKQDVKDSVCLATDYWISCVRWSKISNGQSTSRNWPGGVFRRPLNSLVREKQTSATRGQCGSPGTFFMFVFFFPTYKR